jgi:toxin ParE1/3/4
MKLEYGHRAVADLDAIFDYLDQHSTQAAAKVIATIRFRIEKLKRSPLSGRPTELPGIRSLTIVRYPYIVYYQVRGETVSVVHIRHQRKAPLRGQD